MLFSSPVFLFLFLPLVLALYFAAPRAARNLLLLLASLVFYTWGEPRFVVVMLFSIAANFVLGILVERARGSRAAPVAVALSVTVNLGLLGTYKYAEFLVENLNRVLALLTLPPFQVTSPSLPLGISFFTFHALSYVLDVHRGTVRAQRNPIRMALYIALFPQLIAGPIIRYHYIAPQLTTRVVTFDRFAQGIRRFVLGLGKKVLIANTVAVTADAIFALPTDQLTPGLAWLATACYTLQIYFDFSGYSDMALGLGLLFGFRFPENFNYPYVSRSVTEFWRRWHISLSTWFRDYLYIPLGGNRGAPWRTYVNLVTVFFLCGLWHGASWTFVGWGLFHGLFLVIERRGLGRWLAARAAPLGHAYTLLVVMIGWVFFRATTLQSALAMLAAMGGAAQGTGVEHYARLYLDVPQVLALLVGAVGALPALPTLARWCNRRSAPVDGVLALASIAGLLLVFVSSAMMLAAGTYNPFIYFRF